MSRCCGYRFWFMILSATMRLAELRGPVGSVLRGHRAGGSVAQRRTLT